MAAKQQIKCNLDLHLTASALSNFLALPKTWGYYSGQESCCEAHFSHHSPQTIAFPLYSRGLVCTYFISQLEFVINIILTTLLCSPSILLLLQALELVPRFAALNEKRLNYENAITPLVSLIKSSGLEPMEVDLADSTADVVTKVATIMEG